MSATNAKANFTGSTRKRLGQILLDQGKVAESHLDQALSLQQQNEGRLGAILTEQGFVEPGALRAALVKQAAIETLDLEQVTVDPEALNVISAELAFSHKVLPFAVHNHTLSVAMADPFDRDALEAVRALSGKRIKRFYCAEHPLY